MQNETLPGVLPTARLELEVLLGPGAEIDGIAVRVEDPDGRLIALRTWPFPKEGSTTAVLDAAWRVLLGALPLETYAQRKDNQH